LRDGNTIAAGGWNAARGAAGINDQLDEVEARADAPLEEMLKLLEEQGD
jgi:hypothetical protein